MNKLSLCFVSVLLLAACSRSSVDDWAAVKSEGNVHIVIPSKGAAERYAAANPSHNAKAPYIAAAKKICPDTANDCIVLFFKPDSKIGSIADAKGSEYGALLHLYGNKPNWQTWETRWNCTEFPNTEQHLCLTQDFVQKSLQHREKQPAPNRNSVSGATKNRLTKNQTVFLQRRRIMLSMLLPIRRLQTFPS